MTFSATVRFAQRFTSWYTVLIPAAWAWLGLVKRTSRPSTVIPPWSMRYTPVSALMRVDLPAPFSPMRACTSPRRRVRSTPSRAFTPGKVIVIPVIRTTVSPAVVRVFDINDLSGSSGGFGGRARAVSPAARPPVTPHRGSSQ